MNRRGPAIPVLMYHGVHEDETQNGHFHPIYSVRPADFVQQLDWLVEAGYRTVRLGDIARSVGNATDAKPVVITFDDGDVSNVDVALPLLVERGQVAEFFIVSDRIGEPGWVGPTHGREFVAAGMGVQSHGRTHRALDDLVPAELEDELVSSRSVIQEWAGVVVEALALPGGRGREREHAVARQVGYSYMLGSVPGPNRHWRPDSYLQRIAVTRDMPMSDFQNLVQWTGAGPRRAWARYQALEVMKRTLGNASYARLRSVVINAKAGSHR